MNQSFNAGVNYTNRSGEAVSFKYKLMQAVSTILAYCAICYRQLFIPYLCATGGAVTSALAMNKMTKVSLRFINGGILLLLSQYVPSLVGRFVPYFAVAIANCINIPLIRQK